MKFKVGDIISYLHHAGKIIEIRPANIGYHEAYYKIHWTHRSPGMHAASFLREKCKLADTPSEILKEIL